MAVCVMKIVCVGYRTVGRLDLKQIRTQLWNNILIKNSKENSE